MDLTYDRSRIDEARDKISGSGMTPEEIIEAPVMSDGPSGIRHMAGLAFSTAYDLLNQLADQTTNRRKAFIYISRGYDFDPFPGGRQAYQNGLSQNLATDSVAQLNSALGSTNAAGQPINQLQDIPQQYNPMQQSYDNPFNAPEGQNQFAAGDVMLKLMELTRAANRANVTFYTLDPRGLTTGMADISENYATNDDTRMFQQNTIDTLRVIASETGGIAGVDTNDLQSVLKKIDADTSDYYVLGYRSSNPDPKHVLRNIEVKVKRPGNFEVFGRKDYTLPPPPRKGKGGTPRVH